MSARATLCAALAVGLAFAGPALAEKPAKKDSPFGNIGGGGKDPIKIDADRLDVFDRENRAVFVGNVVAVQGESTIRCSTMTVYYKRGKDSASKDASADAGAEAPAPKNPAENGSRRSIAPARSRWSRRTRSPPAITRCSTRMPSASCSPATSC